jgi:dihydrofolate synthase/folylpolyglutamate synthase
VSKENSLSLSNWLTKLEQLHPTEIELGLDRSQSVYSSLRKKYTEENIDTTFVSTTGCARQIIIVGGTNGKGSTVATLEKALLSKGFSVGVYSSPHLHKYNERVRLNGVDVSDKRLVESFENVEQARGQISLTYFEFGTLAALDIFHHQDLDYALLEVGLGGRLDAVNIVDADVAIITSIDLDHMDWLGDTIEKIGFEKSGIFRSGKPAIIGMSSVPQSVKDHAEDIGSPLLVYGCDFGLDKEQSFYSSIPDLHLPTSNLCCAFHALHLLGIQFKEAEIQNIVSSIHIPGRFEKLSDSPALWVDVGHNPEAARYLSTELLKIASNRPVYAIYSALSDKDVLNVMSALSSEIDFWFLAPLQVPRAMPIETLTSQAERLGFSFKSCPSINDAVEQAKSLALETNGLCIAFGSFYTVADVRSCSPLTVGK